MKGAVQLMTLDPCFLRSMRRVKPFGMLASHIVQADPIGCFLDPDDPGLTIEGLPAPRRAILTAELLP